MKKTLLLCLIVPILFLMNCETRTFNRPISDTEVFFQGNHQLMSLNSFIKTSNTDKSSGFFFVVLGSYESEKTQTTDQIAKFSWKNNKNQYVITNLPMTKVRFQLDSTITNPYVKFRWENTCCFSEGNWQDIVIYAVFVLKPDQIYNSDIALDLK